MSRPGAKSDQLTLVPRLADDGEEMQFQPLEWGLIRRLLGVYPLEV